MSSIEQDRLVIEEVQRHYDNNESPYYLAGLGQFLRSHDIQVPPGVRLKNFIRNRFDDRLLVVQDPDVPAKIAVARPGEQERVQKLLAEQTSAASDDSTIDVTRLPFALFVAFCITSPPGNRVYFRTTRPFRYVIGATAPDHSYVEIDEQFRPPRFQGLSGHNLSAQDKRSIYRHVSEWATAKSLDLKGIYYNNEPKALRHARIPSASGTNALQRLFDAQGPELQTKVFIPVDIAIKLMNLA